MPFSRFSGLTSALTPFPTPPPQRPSSPHSASVFVRVRPWAVPCTTPAPSRPSSIPLALTSFPEPFPLLRPPSAGRGVEDFFVIGAGLLRKN